MDDEELVTHGAVIDPPTDHLADLRAAGVAHPPSNPERHRPARRIRAEGTVSDLVTDQRR